VRADLPRGETVSGRRQEYSSATRKRTGDKPLDRFDVLGTGAFGAAAFGERHQLPFPEVVEGDPLHARGVKEQVFFLPDVDEPETPVRQSFDLAFWHWRAFSSECREGNCPDDDCRQTSLRESIKCIRPRSLAQTDRLPGIGFSGAERTELMVEDQLEDGVAGPQRSRRPADPPQQIQNLPLTGIGFPQGRQFLFAPDPVRSESFLILTGDGIGQRRFFHAVFFSGACGAGVE